MAESPRHPRRALHQCAVLRGKHLVPRRCPKGIRPEPHCTSSAHPSSRRWRQEGRRGGAADSRRTFEYMERRSQAVTPPVEGVVGIREASRTPSLDTARSSSGNPATNAPRARPRASFPAAGDGVRVPCAVRGGGGEEEAQPIAARS
eukprot:9500773-Pyramimonas_sp.AAC.1